MTCLDRETATAYLRGDLEPEEAKQWAVHLASCEACRRVVEEVSALIDDVRQDLMALDVSTHAARHVTWPRVERIIDRQRREPSVTMFGGWLKPATIGAALAALVAVTTVILMRGTTVSAAEILERASIAEQVTEQQSTHVLFRVVTVEERRGHARTLVSRRRVETWRKLGTTVSARRAYNEAGRLVAAEWIGNGGARTFYASGQAPAKSHDAAMPPHLLLTAEQIWRLELSASTFSTLIGADPSARATETPNVVRISFESATTDLSAATLTLSKADLHVIEQTAQLGRGDDAQEFRIAEDRSTRMEPAKVASAVFAVDANLEGTVPVVSTASVPRRVSDAALMGLEIEALRLLDGAGALLGEQVNVTRTATGIIRVDATVDSRTRKEELDRALSSLAGNPSVRVNVETFAAASQRDRGHTEPTRMVRQVEVQKDDIPVGPLLRRYFGASDDGPPDAAVAEQVRDFANRSVEQSRLIVQHAWALKNLAGRYRPEAQRSLDDRARAAWRGVIRRHATAIAEHGSRLRELLQPAFFPDASIELIAAGAPVEDIAVAAERVLALAHTQDEAVRAALVTSATPSSTTFLQTQLFWNDLTELVTLAHRTAAE